MTSHLSLLQNRAVDRAHILAEQLRPLADEAEHLRRPPAEAVKHMIDADLAGLMSPRTYGGLEADWNTYLRVLEPITAASGSLGWCTGFLINHQWFLHMFEKAAVDAVYALDNSPRIVTSFAPFGKARQVSGGFLLAGAWPFGSGGDHCRWAVVGAPVTDTEGNVVASRAFLLTPEQFQMKDSWQSVGLAGSGSNTIIVEETFVPADWSIDMAHAATGDLPGNRRHDAPIFATAAYFGLGLGIYGSAWGVSKAALETYLDFNRDRLATYGGQRMTENLPLQIRIGQSASDIDAGRFLVRHFNDLMVRREAKVSSAWMLSAIAHSMQTLMQATDRLMAAAGARGLSTKISLQRHWRDIHAMSNHAALNSDNAYSAYGRELMTCASTSSNAYR